MSDRPCFMCQGTGIIRDYPRKFTIKADSGEVIMWGAPQTGKSLTWAWGLLAGYDPNDELDTNEEI